MTMFSWPTLPAHRGSSGQIQTFAVDSESGALRQGAPTVSSGGVNPVSIAVTGNYYHLYVANAGSNNVAHFSIATNACLTAKDTVTLAAAPAAVAVNAASNYLYVVSGTTSATLTEYPISIADGTIGAATPGCSHASQLSWRHDRPHRGRRAGQRQ